MKTIIIANDYDFVQGGASSVALQEANLLFSRGIHVVFLSGVSKPEKSILNPKIESFFVEKYDPLTSKNKLNSAIKGIYNFKAVSVLKKILRKYPHSILHIHGITKILSVSIVQLCHKRHVPVILTAHDYLSICPNGVLFNYKSNKICQISGFDKKCRKCPCDSRNMTFKKYRYLRFFVQEKLLHIRQKIDKVFTISDFSQKILLDYHAFPANRMVRINNPCSFSNITYENIKKRESFYLFVGRLSREKGIWEICEEFSMTSERLVVAGSGPEEKELIAKFSNSLNISFLGWCSSERIKKLMLASKALVFPSLWYECAPLTVIEALSSGLPCVVSKYCAAKDYISPKNGIIFDPSIKGDFWRAVLNLPPANFASHFINSFSDDFTNKTIFNLECL
jgi:glycosyltransferase involved in cell wall biosynthesis